MKSFAAAGRRAGLLALLLGATAAAEKANPVQAALDLLTGLQTKIVKEGEDSTKVYDEFAEWCEDRSRETRHSIQTMQAEKEDLEAAIEKASDEMESRGTKVEELSSAITTDEADLKAATLIREKEAADFGRTQKDLLDLIDTIERSVTILEREAKAGASLTQLPGATSAAEALQVLVEASALSAADTARLTSLLQSAGGSGSEGGSEDESGELGAPAAQAYGTHSGALVETMEGLLDKAEAQLEDVRKTEASRVTNFGVLKTSLEGKLKVAQRDVDAAKKGHAESGQRKATSEGDLAVTEKDLKAAKKELGDLHRNCMTKASDFEEEMKSRGEELAALAKAKQVIADMTPGAAKQTYGLAQTSFLQLGADSAEEGGAADLRAVRLVKRMARQQGSTALAQLYLRLDSELQAAAASGADPFEKVKGLISDMVEKLVKQTSAEAQHKAWCDKEMSESTASKRAKDVEVDKLSTKIDQLSASQTSLAEEVASLQKELADLARSQAEMERIRSQEHALFSKQKPEMEDGIKGVKLALKTLREYYSRSDGAQHSAEEGGGAGIIGILQVVESDFSKGLSELIASEESSRSAFEQQSKENEVSRASKEQDVKYKSKQLKAGDKTSTELATDRDGARAELEAVSEYLSKLQDQCVAKAEPYEERKKRQEREIAGLQEALQLLSNQALLLQVGSAGPAGGRLRGVRPHLPGA